MTPIHYPMPNPFYIPQPVVSCLRTTAALAENRNSGRAWPSDPTPAISLNFESTYPVVRMDGETVTAKCLLIATGADYRKLCAQARERFEGAGVYYAATRIEADVCRGTPDVVVVGGGNSAGQAAVFLADQGFHVYRMRPAKHRPATSSG